MPYYRCRLAGENGLITSQSFFAPSSQDCQKYFEEEGYCVLSVKKDWKKIKLGTFPFEKKIKDKDFIAFNQEFIALIKAGYPILKSIGIIINRVENVHLKEILMNVEKEIRAGKSLSEAFSPYEKMFSKVYTASLIAGERSGNLPSTLSRFIGYSRRISQTKSRIKSALTYPTLLLIFSLFLMGILINFVIPRFSGFYADFEAQLPLITRILMSFSLTVRNHLGYILGGFLVLILLYFQLKKRSHMRVYLDQMKLKIPYGKGLWLESSVSIFSRTLAILLGGGISLLQAVGVASQAVPNQYLSRRMENLPPDIKNGDSLSASLRKIGLFPPLGLDMIRIGETSANLEGMLEEVADIYDERIRTKVETFVSLIEPVIIILMGIVVAFMLLSVYLPIFNLIRVT
ncbi:type II secretion system F family protein [bacterium]|nr:type II secretion system F family protein [bacterium]